MWLSLHRLRINLVVLLVGPKKTDHHDAMLVLQQSNQPIVIRFDIEDHPAALEDAAAGTHTAIRLKDCSPVPGMLEARSTRCRRRPSVPGHPQNGPGIRLSRRSAGRGPARAAGSTRYGSARSTWSRAARA